VEVNFTIRMSWKPEQLMSEYGGYAIMDRLAEQSGQGKPPWPSCTEVRISEIASGLGCRAMRISSYEELAAVLADQLPRLARRDSPLVLDIEDAADPTYG
jgi:benzoylformate decarboxylase